MSREDDMAVAVRLLDPSGRPYAIPDAVQQVCPDLKSPQEYRSRLASFQRAVRLGGKHHELIAEGVVAPADNERGRKTNKDAYGESVASVKPKLPAPIFPATPLLAEVESLIKTNGFDHPDAAKILIHVQSEMSGQTPSAQKLANRMAQVLGAEHRTSLLKVTSLEAQLLQGRETIEAERKRADEAVKHNKETKVLLNAVLKMMNGGEEGNGSAIV